MVLDSPGRRFREALAKPPLAIPGVFDAFAAEARRAGGISCRLSVRGGPLGRARSSRRRFSDADRVCRAGSLFSLRRVDSGDFGCGHRVR